MSLRGAPATLRQAQDRLRNAGASARALVIGEVRVFAGAAGLAVLAQRDQVEIAFLARIPVEVGPVPRIVRHRLAQVRPVPLRLVRGLLNERIEAFLGRREASDVEPE